MVVLISDERWLLGTWLLLGQTVLFVLILLVVASDARVYCSKVAVLVVLQLRCLKHRRVIDGLLMLTLIRAAVFLDRYLPVLGSRVARCTCGLDMVMGWADVVLLMML